MADGRLKPPLRALERFAVVPAGRLGLLARGDEFAPHLCRREFAVIDPSDRDPLHGEVYAVSVTSFDGPVMMLAQAIGRSCISDAGAPFIGWFRRYGLDVQRRDAIHIDGPMHEPRWTEKCLGRVVGYIPAPADA